MSATALYHREIFMPAIVREIPVKTIALKPTEHARRAALNDRYGKLEIPATLTFRGRNVIEAELTGGRVTKMVVRKEYDATRDAVYVFLPDGTLKTVWFNLKSDTHKTLRRSLYAAA